MPKSKRKSSNAETSTPWLVYGGLILIAVGVALVLIRLTRPAAPVVEPVYPDIPRGVSEDGHPLLGDPHAPLTLSIYEDLACPNCRRFATEVEPRLVEAYVHPGAVRLEIYTMTFVSAASLPAAEAAYCAGEQGLFWEYRHQLFQMQGVQAFSRSNLVEWGAQVGADRDAFRHCLDAATYRNRLREQSQMAYNFGIRGTPTLEVNGARYEGVHPFESSDPAVPGLKAILDQALQEVKTP